MSEFPAVWQRFLAMPCVTAVAADPDPVLDAWRRGRQRYWVWALEIDNPDVLNVWQACRRQLDTWLLPGYRRQPHITLAVAGFPGPDGVNDSSDCFTPAQLAACEKRLQSVAMAPFELRLGRVNSFAAAPFLEIVDAGGHLQALRERVVTHDTDFRDEPWVPHLTLGYYRDTYAPTELLPALTGCPTDVGLTLRVTGIVLMSYSARDIAGALSAEKRYPLSG